MTLISIVDQALRCISSKRQAIGMLCRMPQISMRCREQVDERQVTM
jgi:hypothetical protein